MAESVEELAKIIKEYAKKNRKLSERVGDIETRLFGQARSVIDKSSTSIQKVGAAKRASNAGLRDSQVVVKTAREQNLSPPV